MLLLICHETQNQRRASATDMRIGRTKTLRQRKYKSTIAGADMRVVPPYSSADCAGFVLSDN